MGLQFFLYSFVFSSIFGISATIKDSIRPGESIREGTTLVSADSSFELGFFSPPNSNNRYLGIWYKKISTGTVVWVANRESPLTDSSGVLEINSQGTLILLNGTKFVFWTPNTTRNNAAAAQNPMAQLLDSGNFVLKDPENILWQSFDYPGDTFLPGMKVGRNLVNGLDRYVSSWKSTEDPAPGDFSLRVDPLGSPQILIRKGPKIIYRGGSWNGLRFTGSPQLKPNPIYTFEFVANQTDVYYTYELRNSSVVSKFVMNESGLMQRFIWTDRTRSWSLFLTMQTDDCDYYALCGAYASCNINDSPVCTCLSGFQPKSPRDWNLVDWSEGCVRTTPLNCTNGDGFVKYAGMKLPDTSYSWYDKSMGLQECRDLCLKKCNCSGYANSDVREGGSGCLLWFGDLVDMRKFTDNIGRQDLYIKMAASELDHIRAKRHSIEKKHIGIIVSSVILVMGVLMLGMIYIKKKRLKRQEMSDESGKEDMELPTFDLATIANATDNFSSNKKLGEGGFGPVYKGILIGGQEIAVKKLSKTSEQGRKEFKNEVILIAKLQHRNLVKILGCCIQENEKLLIYEYMPNRSLDSFIFDKKRSKLLNWRMRIHIICGIARGLLYLHQDSRLRIVHRDLKTSNVLLDAYMNPKISDFGLARTFGGDQSEANTSRVVGTYGYMAPEYAVDGLFSVKSDVFSFGVIVLEILSGKKNRGFVHQDHQLNLLGHAWKLWTQGKPLELVDKLLGDESSAMSEVLRCIHVGLLCVQQRLEDRPNMSSVVLMLGSETSLPQPKQPGFFTERNPIDQTGSSSSKQESYCSTNEASITVLEAR